jgi:ankyrin repeat protein
MDILEAIKSKNLNKVRDLIEQVDDLDEIDFDYESTPLIFAIEHGNEAIVSELLNAGASPSQWDITDTPLTAAARERQSGIVDLLIKAGGDVNNPVEDGITPLMCAASSHCMRSVELLIEAGARMNDVDSDGETAYDKARGDVRTYLNNFSK